MSVWEYESEAQKKAMEEEITPENCGAKLRLVRDVSGLSRRDLAKCLGCSESTVTRIETGKSLPTEDFTSRLRGLAVIGYHKFSNMTEAEKATIGETLGAAGGGMAGVGASIAAVSAAGTVSGLSVTGITSGLAALGGSMIGGIAVVAAIPVAVGAAGYGVVKGIRAICDANNLSCKEVDGRFEIVPEQTAAVEA